MEIEELEDLSFVMQIGNLVRLTAKEIIKDNNLLRSEGTFMFSNHKFKITLEEVTDDK